MTHCLKLLPIVGLAILAGCATVDDGRPGAGSGLDAELRFDGQGVRVNGQAAGFGMDLDPGDRISVTARSAARIDFTDGGWLMIDRGSDPVTVSWSPDRVRVTIDDAVIYGQSGSGNSIWQVLTELMETYFWSEFLLEERAPDFARAYLLAGRMQMKRPVEGPVLGPGQFLEWDSGTGYSDGPYNREQVARLLQRFQGYDFDTPPRTESRPRVRIGIGAPNVTGVRPGRPRGRPRDEPVDPAPRDDVGLY